MAEWTRRGRNIDLTEPRRVQVLHDGQWFDGWVTATRREAGAWWGYVRYAVGVGLMHWQWKHEDELRRAR